VAELTAIAYADEVTAARAAREAQRLREQLAAQSDAIALLVRNKDGVFRSTTSHEPLDGHRAAYGMLWAPLFALLFFVPVLGMTVGAALGGLIGSLERAGIDKGFQKRVRELVQPGTSALFLVLDEPRPRALRALDKYGGTLLKTPLADDTVARLQQELHGAARRLTPTG